MRALPAVAHTWRALWVSMMSSSVSPRCLRLCSSLKIPAPKSPDCSLPFREAVVAVVRPTTPAVVSRIDPTGIWRASVNGTKFRPLVSAANACATGEKRRERRERGQFGAGRQLDVDDPRHWRHVDGLAEHRRWWRRIGWRREDLIGAQRAARAVGGDRAHVVGDVGQQAGDRRRDRVVGEVGGHRLVGRRGAVGDRVAVPPPRTGPYSKCTECRQPVRVDRRRERRAGRRQNGRWSREERRWRGRRRRRDLRRRGHVDAARRGRAGTPNVFDHDGDLIHTAVGVRVRTRNGKATAARGADGPGGCCAVTPVDARRVIRRHAVRIGVGERRDVAAQLRAGGRAQGDARGTQRGVCDHGLEAGRVFPAIVFTGDGAVVDSLLAVYVRAADYSRLTGGGIVPGELVPSPHSMIGGSMPRIRLTVDRRELTLPRRAGQARLRRCRSLVPCGRATSRWSVTTAASGQLVGIASTAGLVSVRRKRVGVAAVVLRVPEVNSGSDVLQIPGGCEATVGFVLEVVAERDDRAPPPVANSCVG